MILTLHCFQLKRSIVVLHRYISYFCYFVLLVLRLWMQKAIPCKVHLCH